MDDKLLGVDITQTAVTLGFSISQIESVMGIVILVIQCCYIAWRFGYNIYNSIKTKEYAKIGDSIITLEDDLIALLKKYEEESMATDDEQERKAIEDKIEKVEKLIEKYGNEQHI